MSGPVAVVIPEPILFELYRSARACFPLECCGWLAGPRDRPDRITRAVACRNPSEPSTRFGFDGNDLVAFSRAFDGDPVPRVLYHSHPRGSAALSPTDRAAALAPWGEPLYRVQQLVIAIGDRAVAGAALWAWAEATAEFVEVARFAGESM